VFFAAVATVAAVIATAGVALPGAVAGWAGATSALGSAAGVAAAKGAFVGVATAGAVVGGKVVMSTSAALIAGLKLWTTVLSAALGVPGTVLGMEGTLSGHEDRARIGAILGYTALAVGFGLGPTVFAVDSLSRAVGRAAQYSVQAAAGTAAITAAPTITPPTAASYLLSRANAAYRFITPQVRSAVSNFRSTRGP